MYVCTPPRRESTRIKLISDAYRTRMSKLCCLELLAYMYAENTFHFADQIPLISNRIAIFTDNESCTFNKNPLSIYEYYTRSTFNISYVYMIFGITRHNISLQIFIN